MPYGNLHLGLPAFSFFGADGRRKSVFREIMPRQPTPEFFGPRLDSARGCTSHLARHPRPNTFNCRPKSLVPFTASLSSPMVAVHFIVGNHRSSWISLSLGSANDTVPLCWAVKPWINPASVLCLMHKAARISRSLPQLINSANYPSATYRIGSSVSLSSHAC